MSGKIMNGLTNSCTYGLHKNYLRLSEIVLKIIAHYKCSYFNKDIMNLITIKIACMHVLT